MDSCKMPIPAYSAFLLLQSIAFSRVFQRKGKSKIKKKQKKLKKEFKNSFSASMRVRVHAKKKKLFGTSTGIYIYIHEIRAAKKKLLFQYP